MASLASPESIQWLLEALQATLSPEVSVRLAAEDALRKAAAQEGFGPALANLVLLHHTSYGYRQLAAVVLKQYVKEHWQEGEKGYTPPTVSEKDKVEVKRLLPNALGDQQAKIRTAVSMAIAAIAQNDWPHEWPKLTETLITAVRDRSDASRMQGALRCLALLAGDIEESQLPTLLPILLPELDTIVASPGLYKQSVQRRAVQIVHSVFSTLGVMSGAYPAETRTLVQPVLGPWMQHCARILSTATVADGTDDWGLKMAVLSVLTQLVQEFHKDAAKHLPGALEPVWKMFIACSTVYGEAVVSGEADDTGCVDSDGDELSLETLVLQLFEFLLTLIGSLRFHKLLAGSLEELFYVSISFMRMAESQVEVWSTDPNQYVADEDDENYTPRISGALLIEESVQVFERKALEALAKAAVRRMSEAGAARAAGQSDWWKAREAAILALGSVADSFLETRQSVLNVGDLIHNLLVEDLNGPHSATCPFLQGRALWALAKFSSAVKGEAAQAALQAAVAGLSENSPIPVKVGACRLLAALSSRVSRTSLRPLLNTIYQRVGSMLTSASEDTLHLVLETLTALIRADAETATRMEASISPTVLSIWGAYVNDPLISEDALEVLQALAAIPGCVSALSFQIVPTLAGILAHPEQQPVGFLDKALDLLTILLQKSPPDVLQGAFSATFGHITALVLNTDDNAILQSGTECLAAFVRGGKEELLSWGPDTLKTLLSITAKLLDPHLDSASSLYVGALLTQLLRQLPSQLAPYLQGLITALIAKLAASTMPTLTTQILLVFARLVHMTAPNVGQLIDLLVARPAEGHPNALSFLMQQWTKWQGEIQGSYQIKLSTTALALLLASGDPRLGQVAVQGKLLPASTQGIMTRSRAKAEAERWTMVPLPVKMLSLLAEALVEQQEAQVSAVEADEDDWEEIDDEIAEEFEEFEAPVTSGFSVFQPVEDFEEFLEEDGGGGGLNEDPDAASDPINQVNLLEYVTQFLQQLALSQREALQACCQELTEAQQAAIQHALSSGEAGQ